MSAHRPLQQSLRFVDQLIKTLEDNALTANIGTAQHWLRCHAHKLPPPLLHQLTHFALQDFLALPALRKFFPFWLLRVLEDTQAWAEQRGSQAAFQTLWKPALLHSATERLSLKDGFLAAELDACDEDDCPRCRSLLQAYTNHRRLLYHWSEDEVSAEYWEYGIGVTYAYQETIDRFRYTLQHPPLKYFLFFSELLEHFDEHPLTPPTLLAWLLEQLFLLQEEALCQSLQEQLRSLLSSYRSELESQQQALLKAHGEDFLRALYED